MPRALEVRAPQENEIELLVSNLLANSLKFSANRNKPEIRITSSMESGHSVVHVSDNGIGIAPEDASRMFDLFTKCQSQFSGAGVGLAIVRRVVERHGGRVWASGEIGLGTTVSFFV